MTLAYVGLGSNLGERESLIREAAALIGATRLSSIVETEPWGYEDQPRFLNAVAEVETHSTREASSISCSAWSSASGACERDLVGGRGRSTSIFSFSVTRRSTSQRSSCRTRASGSADSCSSRSQSSRRSNNPRFRHGPGDARRATILRVSHLDELDEFEAEAELRLKKEYAAVFSLFRYCVLTQDATYLCNKLDMQHIPQPNYPFFHLKMEDVWVWDKNRPTRMIPRAEVYTSSDVTIEELRGDGDEPVLTAEALAKRIGEGRSEIEDL